MSDVDPVGDDLVARVERIERTLWVNRLHEPDCPARQPCPGPCLCPFAEGK